ncbi:SMI1/KNR4 family protein [Streptomyces spectabilis]
MAEDQILAEQTRAAWARIEAWLKEHAPRNYAALPPPCTEQQIRAHEEALNVTLPTDVRSFYLMRNGTGTEAEFDGPSWGGPLPMSDAQWDQIAPCCFPLPDGDGIHPLQTRYFHDYEGWAEGKHLRHLPLISNGDDGLYGEFVDLTEGSDTYGQLGHYGEYDVPHPGGPTLAAYLTAVADAFEAGRGWLGPDNSNPPPVVNGRLDWE